MLSCLFHAEYNGPEVVVSLCRSLTQPIEQLVREMAECPSSLSVNALFPRETLGLCVLVACWGILGDVK